VELAEFLAVLALIVGWLLFRIGRASTRREQIANARAQVHAITSTYGLLDVYFTNNWDEQKTEARLNQVRTLLRKPGMDVIHPVSNVDSLKNMTVSPHAGTLIDSELVDVANEALWRIGVFNAYTELHLRMVATHHPALFTADPKQRDAIIESIATELKLLHEFGVGQPNVADGWYRRLKEAVAANLARLDCDLRKGVGLAYPRGEALLLGCGDALAVVALALALIFVGR
jgi:hypothetical protein